MSGRPDGSVSVVISAFNSEAYLEEAIASALEQDWGPPEVIVVDDGSTDDTVAVARRFGNRLTIVRGSDEGLAATRNRGTAVAHGAYVLHLDADDRLVPTALRTLMGVFANDTSCDVAAGRFAPFISPELPGDVAARFSSSTEPQRGHLSGVALARAEVFQRVGPLDETYRPASDMEWWLRAGRHGVNIRLIDDVVSRRRIHGKNSSLRESMAHQQAALRITREALKQKRAGTA